ncbi:MAG TPA: topoisomerase C-terminal repeat-containing protein, partial [Longimicrobiales bacterium]|nr:topoisomerase C-terminal repeat-containing protein [Longimicrobiales bacterium]
RDVRLKLGPYGPYVELEPEEEGAKPKRVSLPKDRSPDQVDLAFALKLLELPRTLGADPKSGEEVVAGIGRFGPFVRRGSTFASLRGTEALWTTSLEEAVRMLDAKAAGKRVPLKELGTHPETGAEIVVLSGRYGPYVTDGSINATLPKGTEPDEVDLETAVSLLAAKAARGGRGRGGAGRRNAPRKKPAAKKKPGARKKSAPKKKKSAAKKKPAAARRAAGDEAAVPGGVEADGRRPAEADGKER